MPKRNSSDDAIEVKCTACGAVSWRVWKGSDEGGFGRCRQCKAEGTLRRLTEHPNAEKRREKARQDLEQLNRGDRL